MYKRQPTKGATAISAKNSFQFSAVINKLLFSITNFPLFHPFFFTFLLHLCIFYSANLPTFSCPPPIRTLILSQNQCVIHCNSSIDTHKMCIRDRLWRFQGHCLSLRILDHDFSLLHVHTLHRGSNGHADSGRCLLYTSRCV